MSRIGKKPIAIPDGVKVSFIGHKITVKGPKGELGYEVHPRVLIEEKDKEIILSIQNIDDKDERELWGTNRQLVNNMVVGVSAGFERKLEINGVGYKAEVKGKTLVLHVGYSHAVEYFLPDKVSANVEKNVITLESTDKRLLGETASRIRRIRKPEPYKGKGIKYLEEVIKRKAGKQVKGSEG